MLKCLKFTSFYQLSLSIQCEPGPHSDLVAATSPDLNAGHQGYADLDTGLFTDALLLYYSQSIKLIRNVHLQAVREEASSRADSAENATQHIPHKLEEQESSPVRKHSVAPQASHLAIQVQTLFWHCIEKQYIGVNMDCCFGELKAKDCLDTVAKAWHEVSPV